MKSLETEQSPVTISSTISTTPTITPLPNTNNVISGDRGFDYQISDKSMKSKLVKGAKRQPMEIEPKQTCTNINFSGGAYQLTVMPVLNQWKTALRMTKN